jgi:hypothetical protein
MCNDLGNNHMTELEQHFLRAHFPFPQPEKGGHEPRFVYIETIFLPHCDTSIRAVFRASLGSSRSVVGRCLVPPSPVYLLTRDRRRAAWNRVIEPPSYIPVITINSKSKRYTANCPTCRLNRPSLTFVTFTFATKTLTFVPSSCISSNLTFISDR